MPSQEWEAAVRVQPVWSCQERRDEPCDHKDEASAVVASLNTDRVKVVGIRAEFEVAMNRDQQRFPSRDKVGMADVVTNAKKRTNQVPRA